LTMGPDCLFILSYLTASVNRFKPGKTGQ